MKLPKTRLNLSIKNKPLKFPVKKLSNDDEIELKKAMESAAVIYDEWRTDFINTRTPIDQLKDKVNDLYARLEKDIRSEKYRKMILPMLDTKIAELAVIVGMQSHSMAVDVKCGHKAKGFRKPCSWKGLGIIKKSQWEDGSVTVTCPKCQAVLPKSHMKPKDQKTP